MRPLPWILWPALLLAASVRPASAQDPDVFLGRLDVLDPPEEAGTYLAGTTTDSCTPRPPTVGSEPARLIPVEDPGDPDATPPIEPGEGCLPYTNADEVAGKFALVKRGPCGFRTQLFVAWLQGAAGIVIHNDERVGPEDDSTLVHVEWQTTDCQHVPALFITRYRGERLRAAHEAGESALVSLRRVEPAVAAEPGAEERGHLRLGRVYPNPARGRVRVEVEVARPGPVRVVVLDMLGREVVLVHEGPLGVGLHRLGFDGGGLPSGRYVVRVTGGASGEGTPEARPLTVLPE